MSSDVTVSHKIMETQKQEIEAWLKANAGTGTARYGGREGHIRHWLNGDDWLYYEEYSLAKDEEEFIDAHHVFVFKDERVATEFALRFA